MLSLPFLRQLILFGITLLGVQGTIYFLQLASASHMTTADYSQVRVIESLIAVCSLIATFGVPSVALVKVGLTPTDAGRRRVVKAILLAFGILFAVTAVAFLVASRFGLLGTGIGHNQAAVLAIAGLSGLRLVLTAVAQSRQSFVRLAVVSSVGCLLSLSVYGIALLTDVEKVPTWLMARASIDLLICVGLATTELWRPRQPLQAGRSEVDSAPSLSADDGTSGSAGAAFNIFAKALPIGASLVARSLVDNGPVIWLAAIAAPTNLLAQVGLILTIITIALVPGGVVQGVAVPRLTMQLNAGGDGRRYALLFGGVALLTAVTFICLVVASRYFVSWVDLAEVPTMMAGIVIVVAKTIAGAAGGYLLVINRGNAIFLLNCLTLGLAASLAMFLLGRHIPLELPVVVGLLALLEGVAAICYYIVARSLSRLVDVPTGRM